MSPESIMALAFQDELEKIAVHWAKDIANKAPLTPFQIKLRLRNPTMRLGAKVPAPMRKPPKPLPGDNPLSYKLRRIDAGAI